MTRAAWFLTIAAMIALAVSGPGTRMGWWHFRTGLLLFAASGLIAVLAAIVSLVAWIRHRASHQPRFSSIIATLLSVAVAAFVGSTVVSARGKPAIHDISTDLGEVPETAAQQRAAYGDIQPIEIAMPPQEAFRRVQKAAGDLGWKITSSRPEEGVLQASDTTAFFGFTDDVIVRVRAAGGGSRVDVRSTSRVGKSDVGQNAKRIRSFREKLRG